PGSGKQRGLWHAQGGGAGRRGSRDPAAGPDRVAARGVGCVESRSGCMSARGEAGGMGAGATGLPEQCGAMVLLVDDQAMVGEAIRRALADQSDINYHFCSEGEEAVSVARRIRPTVILQDLVMPDVDGLALVRAYRENDDTRDIPIIVLSSREEAV